LTLLEDEKIRLANRNELPDSELAQYERDGLLKRTVHARGIKFAMLITDPATKATIAHGNLIRDRLRSIVEREGSQIAERSLYEGAGFGNYLILGRVDYPRYHEIQALADQVNAVVMPGAHGVCQSTRVRGAKHLDSGTTQSLELSLTRAALIGMGTSAASVSSC
jgi:hypothetical protein